MKTRKKIAFIFPGQGAQYVGMGKDFFENFSIAKETFEEADEILKRNLSSIIFNGPQELLTETRNSQTGIFVNSMALLRVLNREFPDIQPVVTAGLSLGEYSALAASKRISFSEILPLVQLRADYMNQACLKHPGTMAVILGLSADVVEAFVKESKCEKELFVANLNCPGQVVIAGTKRGIEIGTELAKQKGAKRVLPLAVQGAFHSGLMQEAKEALRNPIEELSLKESDIDLVMNVRGDFVQDLEEIKKCLIEQVTSPVRWEASLNKMNETSIDLFIEIGCGKTVSALVKRTLQGAEVISIDKLEDLDLIANICKE